MPIQPRQKIAKICDDQIYIVISFGKSQAFKKQVYKASIWEIGFICVSKKKAEILYKDELRHNNNNLKLNDDHQQI
jgi:hypothetical protein